MTLDNIEHVYLLSKILLNGKLDYIRQTSFILKYIWSTFKSLEVASMGDYCIGLCPPSKDHDNTHVKNVISNIMEPLEGVLEDIHQIVARVQYNNIDDKLLNQFDHNWHQFTYNLTMLPTIFDNSRLKLNNDAKIEDFFRTNLEFMVYGSVRSIYIYMISCNYLIDTSYYYNKRLIQIFETIISTFIDTDIPDDDIKILGI